MSEKVQYYSYLQGRRWSGFLYRTFWLYPRLAKQISGRTLDVGCGIGDFLAFRPGTVGVDVNPLTVESCRLRGFDSRVMAPDHLPFEDGCFNSVVLDNVLEHLSDPYPLLAEIRRVLVLGGRLLVGVPGKRGYARDPDHKVYYSEARLTMVMADAKFNRSKLFYMPLENNWLAVRLSQYCLYGLFTRF